MIRPGFRYEGDMTLLRVGSGICFIKKHERVVKKLLMEVAGRPAWSYNLPCIIKIKNQD